MKVPNFGKNLRWRRDVLLSMAGDKISSQEATMLALPETIKTAFILHPETRDELHRRAALADRSPINLHEVAVKFSRERDI